MQEATIVRTIMANYSKNYKHCAGCDKSLLNMVLSDYRWFRGQHIWICSKCYQHLLSARKKAVARLSPGDTRLIWKLVERSAFLCKITRDFVTNLDTAWFCCYWCHEFAWAELQTTCFDWCCYLHLHCAKRVRRMILEGHAHAITLRCVHLLPIIRDLQFHIARFVALLVSPEAGQVASEVCSVKTILA